MAASLFFLGIAVTFCIMYFRLKWTDKLIFIDKSKRWWMLEKNIKQEEVINIDKMAYSTHKDAALLNRKGKALFIFSVNNPLPMKLDWKSSEWLSSETLMNTINNELIKKLVQLESKIKDLFLLLGAIGGIIAGIASVIILLRTYGAI